MSELILKHGGYRHLKSFQIARLIFDINLRFCNRFIRIQSRTHDQMVQAARSGVQNIAEGSQASATSKKTEMKLTSVARASLEELKLDYEDFLRQSKLTLWIKKDARKQDLVNKRFDTADQFVRWSQEVSCSSGCLVAEAAANGMITLIEVACVLLDRQLQAQADSFLKEGGFTERLYKVRKESRDQDVKQKK